jgi:uncharacterized protein DUF29
MGSLYDADILLWSERQVDLLRRLARGERVNDALDRENVIGEVGDVGRSEFNSVASLLEVGLTHLLLAHGSRRPEPVAHRRSEAGTALAGAARRYAPSVGRRLDLGETWTVALIADREKLAADGGPARRLPDACPFAVTDPIRRPLDLDALLARLAHAAGPPAAP